MKKKHSGKTSQLGQTSPHPSAPPLTDLEVAGPSTNSQGMFHTFNLTCLSLMSYNKITSGCWDLALAPYGRIHVVNLTMAHMILGSIVHLRHSHLTFKWMIMGGLLMVQWRISTPGVYMVSPLISPLFLTDWLYSYRLKCPLYSQ